MKFFVPTAGNPITYDTIMARVRFVNEDLYLRLLNTSLPALADYNKSELRLAKSSSDNKTFERYYAAMPREKSNFFKKAKA